MLVSTIFLSNVNGTPGNARSLPEFHKPI